MVTVTFRFVAILSSYSWVAGVAAVAMAALTQGKSRSGTRQMRMFGRLAADVARQQLGGPVGGPDHPGSRRSGGGRPRASTNAP